ncbi:hypothetical protein SUGI_0742680 [Cryptomeria japonica]|nr:hypothetical protein SUGI_0742680 [Cryptomeria japonica]
MSDFYLQDVHICDDYELDEALDEFLKPKYTKPSFYQKLINIVTMPFHCDEKDKSNDSSQGYIPISSSTKSSNMVVFNDPLYEEISPFESKDKPFNRYDHALLNDALDAFVSPKKHSLHEDPFVQEDDIIPTFPSDGLSFSNKIPTRDDELMVNAYPSPKVGLTHKHPLEKEDEIISNFLNSLSPIEHILRKEDEFNTSIDALPPKDEELINNVISSPEIDNTSNIPFNNLTIWDEPLEEGIDYSLPLAKGDEIKIENSLDSFSPSLNLNYSPSKNKASPSPQFGSTHKDTLVQSKMVNISFKDLPLKSETLESSVDPSPREFIPHVDPLIEDDMTFPSITLPTRTSMPIPCLSPKIDLIRDKILVQEKTINNSSNTFVHSSKPSSINLIHVNETPNKPLFTVQGACPSQNSQPLNKPILVVQGGYANDSFCTPKKPVITVQGGYSSKSPYEYAKQLTRESYHAVAHTYNTRNNRQPIPPPVIPTSLPPSQPILPQAPRISQVLSKEYDLIEQLKATPAKISLWDLIQTSSAHHGMLQDALKDLNVPPPNTSSNIASLVNSMMNPKAQIVFTQDEFPTSEIQHQYDPLMIVVIINDTAIR